MLIENRYTPSNAKSGASIAEQHKQPMLKNTKRTETSRVCLGMSLQCTNYKRSTSRDSGSKITKTKSAANIARSGGQQVKGQTSIN